MNRHEEMTKPTPPTDSGGSPAPSVPPTRLSGRAMSNTMLSVQGTGDDGGSDYSKDSEIIQILSKIIPDIFELGKIGEELMKDKDKEENEGEKCEGGEGGENEEEKEKEGSENILQSLLELIKNLF